MHISRVHVFAVDQYLIYIIHILKPCYVLKLGENIFSSVTRKWCANKTERKIVFIVKYNLNCSVVSS